MTAAPTRSELANDAQRGSHCGCSDLFSAVRPTGWLGKRLANISGRKYRWNKYLRACQAIPKTSPVAGSTSWKKINARRGHLIDQELAAAGKNWKQFRRSEELQALQDVAGAVIAAHLIAQNFLLARVLRKLKAENDQAHALRE